MAGYDLDAKIPDPGLHDEACFFFRFLQSVGRRYPVSIRYRTTGPGAYYLAIDGTPGARIDALLQELILNRGLYYYSCTRSRRREVTHKVIAPLFQALLESRFPFPHIRFLRRHILGSVEQGKGIPGELEDSTCHDYEVLFRKWDIGVVGNWDFVKDTDSLLTRFLLERLGHTPGAKSRRFDKLLADVSTQGPVMNRDTKRVFRKIHRLRTDGLHRLKRSVSVTQLSSAASQLFWYFQYYDEFLAAQRMKTNKLHGKRYRRLKYGDEAWDSEEVDWSAISKSPCHDCGVLRGQYHCFGCDVERCPRCGGQNYGCPCKLDSDWD